MKPSFQNKYTAQPVLLAYAEDHRMVRAMVVSYLKSLGGIKVLIEAVNGEELLANLERSKELPEICLIDIMMPGMDGFETVQKIKRRWPGMKILILSAYLRDDYVIQMILAGVNGYLSKNCHPKEIKQAIFEIREYGIYISENFSQRHIAAVKEGRMDTPQLTEKEIQLLRLSVKDMSYLEIAVIMKTTAKSVEGYRNKLFYKLDIKTRAGLAMYAIKYGYVTLE